jgi:hypothetical protein
MPPPDTRTAALVMRSGLVALNCTINNSMGALAGAPIGVVFTGLAMLGAGGGIPGVYSAAAPPLAVADASDTFQGTFFLPAIVGPRFAWIGFANVTPIGP